MAARGPASRGSRTLEALEMVSPMLFSGRKYSAAGVPRRASKHSVSSHAPPTAIPLSAPTTGTDATATATLNSDGTVQTSCIQPYPTILNQLLDAEVLRRAFPRHSFWGMEPLFSGAEEPVPVEVLSGACLMMKRTVFADVSRFSEEYFLYAEDLDLCYKVNAIGLKNYYVPAASIVHHGGGSSKPSQSTFSAVMMRESVYRFLRKVRGKWYSAGFRVSLGFGALGRLCVLVVLFPVNLLRGNVQGASDSFRKWAAILKWSVGFQTQIANYS